MDSLTDEIESVAFVAREVMVYQVPPRTSAQGYKAAEWDVEKFLWKGRLRVIEVGSRCDIRLEDSNTGELFAQATYATPWTQVEPVLDSSRYFVLRVEGEGGKRAYIGMGFLERSESFDFQAVAKRATQPEETEQEPDKPRAPAKDYSLKEGQTFSIKLPGRDKPAAPKPVDTGSGGGGGLFSLPPPPPPGRRR